MRARRMLAAGAVPVERAAWPGQHIGIIGCGAFAFSTLAHYCPRGSIRGAMDSDPARAAALARAYGAACSTDDPARLLGDPAIDLVLIASNHASHAAYAAAALRAGKHVHIEKPHAVTAADLDLLCAAMAEHPDQAVTLGYNRPLSRLGRAAAAALARENGPAMLSWFIAGHAIPPGHWYHDPAEGGRVLGNLCHWIDMSAGLIAPDRRYPIRLTPVPASADDLALGMRFGDGSAAMIAFSAKAEPFEGVRERLTAHRGATLIDLIDFERLTITRGPRRRTIRGRWRDHGHRASVEAALIAARTGRGVPLTQVRARGELILAAARAIEGGEPVTVERA